MKKILIILLVLVIGFFVVDYINSPAKITYNGKTLNAESPIKSDGEYLIPAKSVLKEIFNVEVDYNIYNKYVKTEIKGEEVVITAGTDKVLIGKNEIEFDSPSIIEKNVLYIPAEYLEAFDLEYSYNNFTKVLEIKD